MGKNKSESKNEGKSKTEILELDEMNVIIRIPKAAASVTVNAVIIDENDKAVKVSRKLSADDIRKARQDFLDNVVLGDDYDARFVLSEEGKKYLERLKDGG